MRHDAPVPWRETNASRLGKAVYPIRLPFWFQSCMRCAPLLEVRERNEIGVLGTTLENICTDEGRSKRIVSSGILNLYLIYSINCVP